MVLVLAVVPGLVCETCSGTGIGSHIGIGSDTYIGIGILPQERSGTDSGTHTSFSLGSETRSGSGTGIGGSTGSVSYMGLMRY